VHFSSCGERPLPQLVDRVGRDRERAVRSAEGKWRGGAELGELVGDQHG
jgi:hypothetical protein